MKYISFPAVFVLLFSCILQSLYLTEAQRYLYSDCNPSANYTSGSVYEQNLNLTLTSLVSNAPKMGFIPASVGVFQCFGNFSAEDCQTCANTAAKNIRQRCPNRKEASIGYERCVIQYSNTSFFSIANSALRFAFCNVNNATDPTVFDSQLRNLLNNLSSDAESIPSRLAYGSNNYADYDINGLVQCTRDLAKGSCLTCLRELISNIGVCGNGKVGAQLYSLSCYLRYETYPFFESPPLQLSPPQLEPSPSPLLEPNLTTPRSTNTTNPAGKKNNTKPIVIVVIPAAAAALLVIFIQCTYLVRRNSRRKTAESIVHEDGSAYEYDNSCEKAVNELSTRSGRTKNRSNAGC